LPNPNAFCHIYKSIVLNIAVLIEGPTNYFILFFNVLFCSATDDDNSIYLRDKAIESHKLNAAFRYLSCVCLNLHYILTCEHRCTHNHFALQ